MKQFFKYLPFLFLLVWGQGSYLHAHTTQDRADFTVRAASPDRNVRVSKMVEVEDDNDEKQDPQKKHSDNRNYFSTFYSAGQQGQYSPESSLPFACYSLHSSPARYILYRVIRI